MMKLASAVGIDVAEAGLISTGQIAGLPDEFAEEKANSLYVRRFDRTLEGGKIHSEDFNQIYRQFPHHKYKHYSYANMARDISNFLGAGAVSEFIRRLVFNAAIGNADMHLKNWSVIYPDTRTPHLAPGYDFVSTIAYIKDREMGLSIANEKDTRKLDQTLLERFAVNAGLPKHMVVETASETAEKTVRVWTEMARDLPLDKHARVQLDEQLHQVPLMRPFLRSASARSPETPALQTGKNNIRRRDRKTRG
jgi:serine/threonine-protein kinase HipA